MGDQKAVWELPEPLSIHEVRVDEDTVVTLRRHGNPEGPRLVLSHGNGLAIDLYYPFWSLLANAFDLVVYDLRNHGWNTTSGLPQHNIPTLVKDHDQIIEAIAQQYGEKPTVGVFHSVSGLVALLSSTRGSRYSALVLFDPPLCKPGRSYEDFDAAAHKTAAMARRRTNSFKTEKEYAEVLQFIPTFRRAVPGVPGLVARTTLREKADDQGFELCCPPQYEAQIIDYASAFAVLVDFDSFHCPVKVIGADPTLPYSYIPTLDLSDILKVDYDFLPETTHFLPLEKPQECVAAMLEFIEPITGA